MPTRKTCEENNTIPSYEPTASLRFVINTEAYSFRSASVKCLVKLSVYTSKVVYLTWKSESLELLLEALTSKLPDLKKKMFF